MPDLIIDPSMSCRIPRHLAQRLIGGALQHHDAVCGLLYCDDNSHTIEAGHGCKDISALRDDIHRHIAVGHRPIGIYQSGRPDGLSLSACMARAHDCCHDITLLLELSADTKGRIELDGFVYRDGGLHPLDVQLEEDGILYPDCVNR